MSENIVYNIYPTNWGSTVWSSIDFYIAVLPDILYKKEITDIMCFFSSLNTLIPCHNCKLSYGTFSKENDTDIYNKKNFETKKSIIKLVWTLREKVNKKLDMDYCIPFGYYNCKLKLLICNDINHLSGIVSNNKDAPFIHESIQDDVFRYLEKKTDYDIEKIKKLIYIIKSFLNNITEKDFDLKNKNFLLLIKRNSKCKKYRDVINANRIFHDYDYINSFKNDYESHIKLLSMGCSYFKKQELLTLIGK